MGVYEVGVRTRSMDSETAASNSEHIHRALETVTDPNARYHLRQALQYTVAAESGIRSDS